MPRKTPLLQPINNIAPELLPLAVDIDSLTPDPDNARLHPDENMEAIVASLRQFGQQKNIVVREQTRIVVAGNGTLAAAKRLGWTRIAASVRPMTELEAMAYALADNRTGDLSKFDLEVVERQLTKLRDEASVEQLIGWSERDLFILRAGMEEMNGHAAGVFSDDMVIEACYAHFKATGFPYPKMPIHSCMQDINALANSPADVLAETNLGIAVADSYHPHRWSAIAEEKYSPMQTYEDDAKFKIAIRKTLEIGGKIGKTFVEGLRYSQGTQACANFRPGFALLMYRRFAPEGGTVLDTSTGYGGRMIGFFASGLRKYIGIDPNSVTCASNKQMAADLGMSNKIEIHEKPAEDVPHKSVAGRCDFAFTSPPYFRKEHYSDESTQSWQRYGDGAAWRDGFLFPMLRLQYAALKRNSKAIINIADVRIKTQNYPLVKWTIEAALATGFKHEGTEAYSLGRVPGAKGAETSSEPVLIFHKP